MVKKRCEKVTARRNKRGDSYLIVSDRHSFSFRILLPVTSVHIVCFSLPVWLLNLNGKMFSIG